MVSAFVIRMMKKYGIGKGEVRTTKYRFLVTKILQNNAEQIRNKTLRMNDSFFKLQQRKENRLKSIQAPDLSKIIPRGVSSLKLAERGNKISEKVKQNIVSSLKEVLANPEYSRTRGALTGTLKDKAFTDLQFKLSEDLKAYRSKNIPTIARTELNSISNKTKFEYMNEVSNINPGVVIEKVWLHGNPITERENHAKMNGTRVGLNEDFLLEGEDGGVYRCQHPHDDSLPAEETINCTCQAQYKFRRTEK